MLANTASSYATATDNLEQVRTQLVELIKGTEGVAQATYEALQTIRSVGGPEILVTSGTQPIEKAQNMLPGDLIKLVHPNDPSNKHIMIITEDRQDITSTVAV